MSEAPQQAQQQPALMINAQYVKDLSFEIPGAPGIFTEIQNVQPELQVQVNVNIDKIRDNIHEVALRINVEAKAQGKVIFIVDCTYAGIFTLNVPEEHVQAVLLIECPRLLFPYARNILSEITRDGSFPPVFLQPIDFAAMFQARMNQVASEQGGAAPAGALKN